MEDDVLNTLGKRVASKLEDCDFKREIRLACSDDRLAPFNSATLAVLQEKHPVTHPDTVIPPTPNPIPVQVDPVSVARAIRSFPSGSAGGPDRLRPQHLKDLLQTAGDEDSRFQQSLASFCALVMVGSASDCAPLLFWCSPGGAGEEVRRGAPDCCRLYNPQAGS